MGYGHISQSTQEKYLKVGRMLSHLYWLFVGLRQIEDEMVGDMNMVYYVKRRYEEFMRIIEGFEGC